MTHDDVTTWLTDVTYISNKHLLRQLSCYIERTTYLESAGTDLEAGVGGRQIRGSGGRSPPEAAAFKKSTQPENERHILMLLLSFFIAVPTGLAVIFAMC